MRKAATSSQGIFPNETYTRIFGFANASTRKACANVCSVFRRLRDERFAFSHNFSVSKFEALERRSVPWNLFDIVTFAFQRQDAGTLVRTLPSANQIHYREYEERWWSLVISEGKRRSVISEITFEMALKDISPKE